MRLFLEQSEKAAIRLMPPSFPLSPFHIFRLRWDIITYNPTGKSCPAGPVFIGFQPLNVRTRPFVTKKREKEGLGAPRTALPRPPLPQTVPGLPGAHGSDTVSQYDMETISQPVLENFIVLEGLDGAGTTTQLTLLDRLLGERGVPHAATFEPTDGPVGELIRSVLRKEKAVRPETLALLFAADREEHLSAPTGGIRAALAAGKLVICDRYLFSSLAYQSVASGFDFVSRLNGRFPLPSLLVYLDTPVSVCAERRSKRNGTELFEQDDFQERVARAYERSFALYASSPMRLERIDGTDAAEKIRDRIWNLISSLPIVKG